MGGGGWQVTKEEGVLLYVWCGVVVLYCVVGCERCGEHVSWVAVGPRCPRTPDENFVRNFELLFLRFHFGQCEAVVARPPRPPATAVFSQLNGPALTTACRR